MSSDAKIWGHDYFWEGVHDGDCNKPYNHHVNDTLYHILGDIEDCLQTLNMRWQIHVYPDGTTGLRGWVV